MFRNVVLDSGLYGAIVDGVIVQLKRSGTGLFGWTGNLIANAYAVRDILVLDSSIALFDIVPDLGDVLFIDMESVPDEYKVYYSDIILSSLSTFQNQDVSLYFGRFKI